VNHKRSKSEEPVLNNSKFYKYKSMPDIMELGKLNGAETAIKSKYPTNFMSAKAMWTDNEDRKIKEKIDHQLEVEQGKLDNK